MKNLIPFTNNENNKTAKKTVDICSKSFMWNFVAYDLAQVFP